ncbi:hypothetical protein ACJMK2_036350 [Sinanodonta woodiana]|uniref:Aldose 1-epimerase n=2 Tax=Sinanodonta woodiana TaxID=1069815 RepID=A0ABD3WKH5_SINWO
MAPSKKTGNRNICLLIFAFSLIIAVLLAVVIYLATRESVCKEPDDSEGMSITKEKFGNTDDGEAVYRFTLKNKKNMVVQILNYGGIISNLFTPDKNGKLSDITLGFDDFEAYKTRNDPYFGGLIGRYANRIAKGKFTLDGVNYTLAINNGPNALHGGLKGFDKRIWVDDIVENHLILTYTSQDGEEGYPGKVTVTVIYELTSDNRLIIDYTANTTKPTVINLTNHAYFNLGGQETGSIADHVVRFEADHYLPVDNTSIPTGFVAPVNGTPFDLTNETRLGDRLPQVPGGIGFDHNFCLGKPNWMKHGAWVLHPESGRTLNFYTTEPGVQFYTSYYLNNVAGKGGVVYHQYGGFCLEAQHYPDSPNQPDFPTTVLRPGETYKQTTVYHFGVQ